MEILSDSESPSSVSSTMVDSSASSSSTTSIQLDGSLGDGGRAIDRHNPIIRDSSRIGKSLPPSPHPASLLVSPKPHLNKNDRYSSTEGKSGTKKQSNLKPNEEKLKSKYIVDDDDNSKIEIADSTRFLLSDPLASVDNKDPRSENVDQDDKYSSLSTAKQPAATRSSDQVVVLRVSLHCKGCERKMRKHLSKMHGVTSFNIDFAAKKVTVVGDLTPLQVIASISKVKNIAQISTPSPSMLSSSSSSSPSPLQVN